MFRSSGSRVPPYSMRSLPEASRVVLRTERDLCGTKRKSAGACASSATAESARVAGSSRTSSTRSGSAAAQASETAAAAAASQDLIAPSLRWRELDYQLLDLRLAPDLQRQPRPVGLGAHCGDQLAHLLHRLACGRGDEVALAQSHALGKAAGRYLGNPHTFCVLRELYAEPRWRRLRRGALRQDEDRVGKPRDNLLAALHVDREQCADPLDPEVT